MFSLGRAFTPVGQVIVNDVSCSLKHAPFRWHQMSRHQPPTSSKESVRLWCCSFGVRRFISFGVRRFIAAFRCEPFQGVPIFVASCHKNWDSPPESGDESPHSKGGL
jgi:hypothetical protein